MAFDTRDHSENPIDALKPLVGILLADRDTKTNDSTELAKIVLDEMKSCESRYVSTGTITSKSFSIVFPWIRL